MRDTVQLVDLFNRTKQWSKHRYPQTACHKKLVQIELSSTMVRTQNGPPLIKSPRHIELWLFGWPLELHRRIYPLMPIPTAVFVPYILSATDRLFPCSGGLGVRIDPCQERMLIADLATERERTLPFLPFSRLMRWKKRVWSYEPEFYNQATFDAHIMSAIAQVKNKFEPLPPKKAEEAYGI
jgi:hypothetical protein